MKLIYQFLFIVVGRVLQYSIRGLWLLLARMIYATRLRLVAQNHLHEYSRHYIKTDVECNKRVALRFETNHRKTLSIMLVLPIIKF
jgi:hypothetical protein